MKAFEILRDRGYGQNSDVKEMGRVGWPGEPLLKDSLFRIMKTTTLEHWMLQNLRNSDFPASRVLRMDCFLVFSGSEVLGMVCFPKIPNSQAAKT